MQLWQKRKIFSQFFITFSKFTFNFEHFQRKNDPHSWSIFELTDPKYVVGEMSKNSRFRGPFDNWHGNRFERLLKSERQHRLFVNPLTAYDKYSVLNRGNLFHYLQMQLSQQGKIFPEFFLQFSKCRFLNLRTPKNVVRYMSKKSLSDDPSTSNMVNGPKHCWNLNDSTFTIFIDRCEENHALKIFCDWYWKSSDCLLTHWLPMTSILFLTEAIYCNIFRCNYLRNEKNFRNLFLHFLNLDSILNIFKKKITLIADAFLNLGTPK